MPGREARDASLITSTDSQPTDAEFCQLVSQVTELQTSFAGIRSRIERLRMRLDADRQALRQP